MKKYFENPKMNVSLFSGEDIVTASKGQNYDAGYSDIESNMSGKTNNITTVTYEALHFTD